MANHGIRIFLYKGKEYKGTTEIVKGINEDNDTNISIFLFRSILNYRLPQSYPYYKSILNHYDILSQIKILDKETNAFVPILQYDNYNDYVDKYNNSNSAKVFRYKGTIVNGVRELFEIFNKGTRKKIQFRWFKTLIREKVSTSTIRDKNILRKLKDIEIYDYKTRAWTFYFTKDNLIIKDGRIPVRRRYNRRFDNFLYTDNLFTDTTDNDKINELINKSIKKKDIETFAILIHDTMINQLGNSIQVYNPLYEQEPEDFALYTVEVCYYRVFHVKKKVPTDWIKFINYRVSQKYIINFRQYNNYQDAHEEKYMNKSSLFDNELDLFIKKISGIGAYSFELIDDKEKDSIEMSLEDAIDYLLNNYCLSKKMIESKVFRDNLTLSVIKGHVIVGNTKKEYQNDLVYLFNQFNKIFIKKS